MKKFLFLYSIVFLLCIFANAQDGPGGLGTGTGDAGNGDGTNGVSDVSGGAGTTGGSQGTEAPVDGGIAILFAIGSLYTALKLSEKQTYSLSNLVVW